MDPSSYPGSDPGSDPSSSPGSDPGSDPNSDPGSDPSSSPGSDPGSDPGFILSLSQVFLPQMCAELVSCAEFRAILAPFSEVIRKPLLLLLKKFF